jgi:hypothetical protein
LRQASHPKQDGDERNQRDQCPPRDAQLFHFMREKEVAGAGHKHGHHQPAVHLQVCAPRILFAAAEKDFVGNIWVFIHNETSVKHPCHVSSILYIKIL